MSQQKKVEPQEESQLDLMKIKIIIMVAITAVLVIAVVIVVKFANNKSTATSGPTPAANANKAQVKTGGEKKGSVASKDNGKNANGGISGESRNDAELTKGIAENKIEVTEVAQTESVKEQLNTETADKLFTQLETITSSIDRLNEQMKSQASTTKENAPNNNIDINNLKTSVETLTASLVSVENQYSQLQKNFEKNHKSTIAALKEQANDSVFVSLLNYNEDSKSSSIKSYLKGITDLHSFAHSYNFNFPEHILNDSFDKYKNDIDFNSLKDTTGTDKLKQATIKYFMNLILMKLRMDYATSFKDNCSQKFKELFLKVNDVDELIKIPEVFNDNISSTIEEGSPENSNSVPIIIKELVVEGDKKGLNFDLTKFVFDKYDSIINTVQNFIENIKNIETVKTEIETQFDAYKEKIKLILENTDEKQLKLDFINNVKDEINITDLEGKINSLKTEGKKTELSSIINEIKQIENTEISESLNLLGLLKEIQNLLTKFKEPFNNYNKNKTEEDKTPENNTKKTVSQSVSNIDDARVTSEGKTLTTISEPNKKNETEQNLKQTQEAGVKTDDETLKLINEQVITSLTIIDEFIFFLDYNNSLKIRTLKKYIRIFDTYKDGTTFAELFKSIYSKSNTQNTKTQSKSILDLLKEIEEKHTTAENKLSLLETELKVQYKTTRDAFSELVLTDLKSHNQDQIQPDTNGSHVKNNHELLMELLKSDQEKYLKSYTKSLLDLFSIEESEAVEKNKGSSGVEEVKKE